MIRAIVFERLGIKPGDRLPKFTSHGSYPLIYLTKKDEVLCAECAQLSPESTADEYEVTYVDVFYEGENLQCEECGCDIQPAYPSEADHGH